MDFRGIQEDYKLLRTENAELRLRQTQLQGELATQVDHINSMELELSKLRSKCEVSIYLLIPSFSLLMWKSQRY